jgi:hypothetical protein
MRPAAAAGLADALRARVSARIARRMEGGNPAEAWSWSADGRAVTTDGGEVVTVAGPEPIGAEGITCSCLLSPKCLHVLAVGSALPGAASAEAGSAEVAPSEAAPAVPEPAVAALDLGQRGVVGATRRAAIAVLLAGASGIGATARDDLSRAVHGCRAVGLHRLARAGQRVLRQVLRLQRQQADFTLADLVDDLRELLLVAAVLGGERPLASFVGTGRRRYEPVGTLRLFGLCTEPVIAGTGHAGVSTLLCDASGRLWTVSDVMPGPPARARATYDAPAAIGGATLRHRALGRDGLFVQEATASSDGRLGSGAGVKAVRAGPSAWTDPGPAAVFDVPLAQQLDRVFGGGPDWLFLRGTVLGAHEDALALEVDGLSLPVRLVAPSASPLLATVDNLRLLARAPGLPLQVAARAGGRRGVVEAVAVGPWAVDGAAARLVLPTDWVGRCNLAFDGLVASNVEGLGARPVDLDLPEVERHDPLEPLRRRIARLALGGRGTLPGDVRGAVEREIAVLDRVLMPVGGRVLAGLADGAAAARTEGGEALASGWLAAAVYERDATRRLLRAAWR